MCTILLSDLFFKTSLNRRNFHAYHSLSKFFSTCTTSDACHCSKHLSQHDPACEWALRLLPGSHPIPGCCRKGVRAERSCCGRFSTGQPCWSRHQGTHFTCNKLSCSFQVTGCMTSSVAYLLSPPMHCLSPKPEMLPLIVPAHLSAVPGCQYKCVPAGRCLVHQHISGKPIASACA